jgi:excisionase family DNA binding protein
MSTLVHERLLTVRDVARRLAVSEKTIRRMVDHGLLPALRVGHAVRFDPDEIQSWLYSSPAGVSPLPTRAGRPEERGR